MTRAQRIKRACEKVWNEMDTQDRLDIAGWEYHRGQLVLYVGLRYRQMPDTDYEIIESPV